MMRKNNLCPSDSGKTELPAHIELLSKFPYLKFCTAQTMLNGKRVLQLIIHLLMRKMKHLKKRLTDKKVFIGIKTLLDLIEVAKQANDKYHVAKFLATLEGTGGMV
ncbi:unnamed protein product [Didymodactylos carnosus]|uniref:NSF AAA+ ATPase lid domain-containing protein n=1 Tax=Didymodactylos carnosus TaxID=1234261 RepID=A0A815PVQ1_9BILA|nr:unnamed protein product [Didymodactylos carnosus]CAF1453726.1 unnamed protein product [Didymodactylos carnosus]CAF4094028.1 unnamed protein product [Didymodactylos carnosus]CAF4326255.1 unnamed protein product [Didymodactylos carnosus]